MAQYRVYEKTDTVKYKNTSSSKWENVSIGLDLTAKDSVRLYPHSALSITLGDDLFVCDMEETELISGFQQMTVKKFARSYKRWFFDRLYVALRSTVRVMGQDQEDDTEKVAVYDRNKVLDILNNAVKDSRFSVTKGENGDVLLLWVPKSSEDIQYFDVLIEYYSRSEGTYKYYFPFQERGQNVSLGETPTAYNIPLYGIPSKQKIQIYVFVSPAMFLIGEYEGYVKLCFYDEIWSGECYVIEYSI